MIYWLNQSSLLALTTASTTSTLSPLVQDVVIIDIHQQSLSRVHGAMSGFVGAVTPHFLVGNKSILSHMSRESIITARLRD